MPADLHVHSSYSDGTESPEEIVAHAKKAGLTVISLTDHDTVQGVAQATKAGQRNGVEVIPGIEFSTEGSKTEIHILGYFIDCENPELLGFLKKIQSGRKKRIYKIAEKLKKLGVSLDPEKVLKYAGNDSPGRPHVARVMVNEGIVKSFNEAFNRFIDFRAPAYVPHYKLDPKESIKLIKRAGGIAIFAHPEISGCDELIPEFVEAGLGGLEAYYPYYQEATTQKFLDFAKKYGLLVTGGSDYHGIDSGREIKLGDFTVEDSIVEKLKDEHLR